MKKLLFILLVFSSVASAQFPKFGEGKGLFMAIGVGPSFPISDFSAKQSIGVGFNVTLSYTDNEYLPVFLYGSIGYMNFPGRQNLYKTSNYSSLSSNVLVFEPGIRYYFPPLIENIVLLMPIVEAGVSFSIIENLHQYKIDSGKPNYVEDLTKFGFHVGAGFSMFMLDVITSYHYLKSYQYLSFNLRVNIPIFVKI